MQDIVLYLRQVRTETAAERDLVLKRAWERATELLNKEQSQLEKAHEDGIEYAVNQSEKNGFLKMSRGDEYYENTFQLPENQSITETYTTP